MTIDLEKLLHVGLVSLVVLVIALFARGTPSQEDIDEAYADGYDEGYSDCLFENEDKCLDYGDEMYYEGFDDGAEAAANYIWYASWARAAEDAVYILDDYFKGEYGREDALEALDDLLCFMTDYETAVFDVRKGKANID